MEDNKIIEKEIIVNQSDNDATVVNNSKAETTNNTAHDTKVTTCSNNDNTKGNKKLFKLALGLGIGIGVPLVALGITSVVLADKNNINSKTNTNIESYIHYSYINK